MQSVLVTGASGFIGSRLCPLLLERGFRVIGVDNFFYSNRAPVLNLLGHKNFEFHEGAIRNVVNPVDGLIKKVDAVVHLAALVGAPICNKMPLQANIINKLGTLDLARQTSKAQRFIYLNTNSGYGETSGEAECTEESPINPISLYGQTKCDGEAAVLDILPLSASLRLATVFGASPRMRFDLMVNDFTEQLYRNGRIELYEPHFLRNFVHIRDVCNAIYFFLCGHKFTGVYNVGLPNGNLTKLQLAHKICGVLGLPEEIVTVGEGTDPDKRNYRVSNKKLLATGFKFAYGLEDGIREVAQVCELFGETKTKKMRNA